MVSFLEWMFSRCQNRLGSTNLFGFHSKTKSTGSYRFLGFKPIGNTVQARNWETCPLFFRADVSVVDRGPLLCKQSCIGVCGGEVGRRVDCSRQSHRDGTSVLWFALAILKQPVKSITLEWKWTVSYLSGNTEKKQPNHLADNLQSKLTKLRKQLELATYFLSDPKLPAVLLEGYNVRTNTEARPINFPVLLGRVGWSGVWCADVGKVHPWLGTFCFFQGISRWTHL